jgi:hypothetical protein
MAFFVIRDLDRDGRGDIFILLALTVGLDIAAGGMLLVLLPLPLLDRLRILSSIRLKDSSCRCRFLDAPIFSTGDGSRNAAMPIPLGPAFSTSLNDACISGFGRQLT